jgi:hypothetical protein
MAKMADDAAHHNFRDRARQEYDERRAEEKLGPAQRTCITLDEKAGKTVTFMIFTRIGLIIERMQYTSLFLKS